MSETKVEGVPLTYDKRKKGHKFSWQGMEIFFKGKDTEEERKKIEVQVKELLGENKNETASSFAEGGMEDGGLKDEGGTVDPVSGNEVPSGSTQSEVRDDIPAQLSEGEFVFPADVVRYIGLENLMELRAKAKQGLAKMEAMGQMGNSDEATMEDNGEYESEIDDLIDNFDPDDPESMEFSQGGVVYAQQGAYMQGQPQQQFSYGFMPPQQQGFQAPGYSVMPTQTPFITSPARVAVGQAPVAPELRRYIGPNNEVLMIPFYDGKPMKGYTIPSGYKYKPEEEAIAEAPEIAKPTVQRDDGGGDNTEQQQAEQARYQDFVNEMKELADLDPEFNAYWSETVQGRANTGKGLSPLDLLTEPALAFKAVTEAFAIGGKADASYEKLANQYGFDMKDYTSKNFFGMDVVDKDKLRSDIKDARRSGRGPAVTEDDIFVGDEYTATVPDTSNVTVSDGITTRSKVDPVTGKVTSTSSWIDEDGDGVKGYTEKGVVTSGGSPVMAGGNPVTSRSQQEIDTGISSGGPSGDSESGIGEALGGSEGLGGSDPDTADTTSEDSGDYE